MHNRWTGKNECKNLGFDKCPKDSEGKWCWNKSDECTCYPNKNKYGLQNGACVQGAGEQTLNECNAAAPTVQPTNQPTNQPTKGPSPTHKPAADLSGGAIAGIAVGSVAFLVIVIVLLKRM